MMLKVYRFNFSVKKIILFVVLTIAISYNLYSQQIENNILAEVGSKKITAHDFKEFLMDNLQSCGRIQNLSEETIQVYLDSLINFTLMLNEAKKNNLDEDPAFVKKISRFKNKIMIDKLIETQVIDSLLTVEKLKSFYKKYGGELQLKQLVIRFKNDSLAAKVQIQNIYEKINNGLKFSDAAKKFSQDAMTAEKGGDIGFVRWGQISENIQNAAFDLKPGEISKPIKTPFGYYLIQLVSKVKCGFNDELRNLKYQMAAYYPKLIENNRSRYLIRLEKKYGLNLINSNIKKIAENVGSPYSPFESFSKNLYEIPLARYDNKSINLSDLINSVGQEDLTNYRWDEKSISKWVSAIGMNKISLLEAEHLKLDVSNDVKKYKDHQIIVLVKNNLIDQDISAGAISNYYNKNKNDFVFPDRIRVQYVVVAEKFIAENIFKMAKNGKNFNELVNDYTLDAISRETNGDIGFISRNQFREVYDACRDLKIGEITGPIPASRGYVVVKLIDREKSRAKKFEEAKDEIADILLEKKKNSAYVKFIAKLKSKFKITINKKMFAEFIENPLSSNLSFNSDNSNKSYAKTSN